jgi:hypothetical protein
MNQTTAYRIDLSIVKHHFARTETLDIDGKDRIAAGFRSQDSRQIAQRGNGGNRFRAPTVNRDRHHSFAPDTPGIILSATFALLCLDLKLFFLRHDFSLHTFSDRLDIADFRLPIADLKIHPEVLIFNWQLAIGNRQCFSRSLMGFV